MRVRLLSIVLALTSASVPALAAAPARLPSAEQVEAYVRENWGDYARRVDGQPVSVQLVAVHDVVCRDAAGTPDCAFTVTVRLADGGRRDQALSSSFDWTADGQLEEVVVLRRPHRIS